MRQYPSDVAFTPAVKAIQERKGSRRSYARMERGDGWQTTVTPDPAYPGEAERAVLFTVEAWDVNCPQHIHRRFSERQIAPVIEQLQTRIAGLEGEVERLRSRPDHILQPGA